MKILSGIIKPAYELQESMIYFVKSAFEDANVLVYILEIEEKTFKDIVSLEGSL